MCLASQSRTVECCHSCHVRGEGGVNTTSHSLQYWPLIGQLLLTLTSHWSMSLT